MNEIPPKLRSINPFEKFQKFTLICCEFHQERKEMHNNVMENGLFSLVLLLNTFVETLTNNLLIIIAKTYCHIACEIPWAFLTSKIKVPINFSFSRFLASWCCFYCVLKKSNKWFLCQMLGTVLKIQSNQLSKPQLKLKIDYCKDYWQLYLSFKNLFSTHCKIIVLRNFGKHNYRKLSCSKYFVKILPNAEICTDESKLIQ